MPTEGHIIVLLILSTADNESSMCQPREHLAKNIFQSTVHACIFWDHGLVQDIFLENHLTPWTPLRSKMVGP